MFTLSTATCHAAKQFAAQFYARAQGARQNEPCPRSVNHERQACSDSGLSCRIRQRHQLGHALEGWLRVVLQEQAMCDGISVKPTRLCCRLVLVQELSREPVVAVRVAATCPVVAVTHISGSRAPAMWPDNLFEPIHFADRPNSASVGRPTSEVPDDNGKTFLHVPKQLCASRAGSVFRDISGPRMIRVERYAHGEAGPAGSIKVAVLTLCGRELMCSDSPIKHGFTFPPSSSTFVEFDSMAELERIFSILSDGGQVLMPLGNYGFSQRSAGSMIGLVCPGS